MLAHPHPPARYAPPPDMLGARSPAQYAAIQEALVFLASPEAKDAGKVLDWLLKLGGVNLKTMAMLSDAHASRWARRGLGLAVWEEQGMSASAGCG